MHGCQLVCKSFDSQIHCQFRTLNTVYNTLVGIFVQDVRPEALTVAVVMIIAAITSTNTDL